MKAQSNLDVLLVNLPPWGVDGPALGTACLSSYLRNKGISTSVYDFNIKLYNKVPERYKYLWIMSYSHFWRQEEKFADIKKTIGNYFVSFIDEIINLPVKVCAISLPTNCSDLLVKEIVTKVKRADPNRTVILGGVSVSIREQRIPLVKDIEDCIDFCVVGEGEEALHQLVVSILSRKNDHTIAGVLKRGNFFDEMPPVYIHSLAQLPVPTFEEFNLNEYKIPKSFIMEFSRGCIGRCLFCDFKSVSPLYRIKPARYIYEQIKFYKEKYHIQHISACDSALNGNMKALEEVCDLLIENNIKIDISGLAIPRKEMTRDILTKMKQAGFIRLEYGIESGSNKVLKAMKKIFTSEIAERVVRDTYGVGITTCLYLLVGFPGESEDDFCKTKEFILRNAQYISLIRSVNPLYIMAGSEIFNKHKEYGIDMLGASSDMEWFIRAEGNTRHMREERVKELKDLIRQQQICFTEDAECLEFTNEVLDKKLNHAVDFIIANLPPWGQNNPHVGIGYLCSYLRSQEISIKVLDLNKMFFVDHSDFGMLWHVENKNFWSNENSFSLVAEIFNNDIERAINEIADLNPWAVGFSVVDPKERLTIEFIRRLKFKAPHTKIILGGPATSTQEQRQIFVDTIGDLIDVFVVGEGEEACHEVLKRIKEREALEDTDGTVVQDNGKWSYVPFKPIEPLEKLPFPTYEEFDMELYGKSLLVEWSRGCYSRCAFCKNWRIMPFYRAKSPQWVFEELSYHNRVNGIAEFTVVDSIMNGNPQQLNEICNLLISNKLKISWLGQIAPRKDMGYGFFKHMREAGCRKLQIGVESGSNRILKNMRKAYTVAIAEATLRNVKRAGIETEIFIIVGFPGEDDRDFKKTYNFIARNRAYIDTIKSINTLHLIAGTEVYEKSSTSFNMKPLPLESDGWHYRWETRDGNNYHLRRQRAQTLLDLAYHLGIKVMETNICEGKEAAIGILRNETVVQEKLKILKDAINDLQDLPHVTKEARKKRTLLKWLALILVSSFAFFYIVYFWFYMRVRKKVLLGAKTDH